MMNPKRLLITILLLAVILVCTPASRADGLHISPRDSLENELSLASTPADSMRLLYNLYDYAPRSEKYDYSKILMDVARRENNIPVQLDLLRNDANIYLSSDSMLQIFEKAALELPESTDQKQTVLFIKLIGMSYKMRSVAPEERRKLIQQLIKKRSEQKDADDIYSKIETLYFLSLCMSYLPNGEMYGKYMDELEKLIDQLPPSPANPIKNLFYTRMAILATTQNNREKAVEADKKLLGIIEQLKKKYDNEGRIYRNYDVSEYTSRSRMLRNFEALTREEVETNYTRILTLAAHDKDIKRDFEKRQRATTAYLLANKEYAKALPILKAHSEEMLDRQYMPFYLKNLILAARATGDNATLLSALESQNNYLKELISAQAEAKAQELQILYDFESLRQKSSQLQKEKIEMQHATTMRIIIGASAAGILLVVFLVIVSRMYYRQKKLSSALMKSEQQLKEDKKSLIAAQQEIISARDEAENANRLKTQFIQNMRHEILTPLNTIVGFSQLIADSMPEETAPQMEKYSSIIADNNEILHTVITDIIDISQLESGEMKISYRPESLNEICECVFASVEHKAAPEVKMSFDSPDENLVLYTDRVRVEQVLTNLLVNAAKFTKQGSITLTYKIDKSRGQVIFSVTDTGIGIPREKQNVIFDRFVKLDPFSAGTGLGLNICRLIADMLNGEVKVDPTYTAGARFLFILPLAITRD